MRLLFVSALLLLWSTLLDARRLQWLRSTRRGRGECNRFLTLCDRDRTCKRTIEWYLEACSEGNTRQNNCTAKCANARARVLRLRLFKKCTCDGEINRRDRPWKYSCDVVRRSVTEHTCATSNITVRYAQPRSGTNSPKGLRSRKTTREREGTVPRDYSEQFSGNSCTRLAKLCRKNEECNNKFEFITTNACSVNDKTKTCKFRDSCERELKHAKEVPHLEQYLKCSCPTKGSASRRCMREFADVNNNRCIQQIQNPPDGTCMSAFARCSEDVDHCLSLFTELMSSCNKAITKNCDVDQCYNDISYFYTNMKDKRRAYDLIYCNGCGDEPACYYSKGDIEDTATCPFYSSTTPPTCTSLLDKCESNGECWESYERFLHSCEPTGSGGCLRDVASCRWSLIGMYGTLIPRRCTCSGLTGKKRAQCMSLYNKLHRNTCVDAALYIAPNTSTRVMVMNKNSDLSFSVSSAEEINNLCYHKDVQASQERNEAFLVFNKESSCHLMCNCLRDQHVVKALCTKINCPEPRSCKIQNKPSIEHGLSLTLTDGRSCTCWGSEIICSRPDNDRFMHKTRFPSGTTILAGYSRREGANLLKYGFTFDSDVLTTGVTSLMMDFGLRDSCRVQTERNGAGYLMINFSPERSSSGQDIRDCETSAREFMKFINIRHPSLISRALLNSIKVASTSEPTTIQIGGSRSIASRSSFEIAYLSTLIVLSLSKIYRML